MDQAESEREHYNYTHKVWRESLNYIVQYQTCLYDVSSNKEYGILNTDDQATTERERERERENIICKIERGYPSKPIKEKHDQT